MGYEKTVIGNLTKGWNEGEALPYHVAVACQDVTGRAFIKGGVFRSVPTSFLFDAGIFLVFYTFVRFLLQPLRMPFVAQQLAGFIVGPVFGIYMQKFAINRPSMYSTASLLAQIGFFLQLFMLGVEVNISKLRKPEKKSFIIGYVGLFTSFGFTYGTHAALESSLRDNPFSSTALPAILVANATNYLLSTASHLNDLGMSNSKLGHVALATSMVTDITVMIVSVTILNIVVPVLTGKKIQLLVILYYLALFFAFRPLIIYLTDFKKEGDPLKRTHFVMIILLILVMALLGDSLDQKYSPFLVALLLPEEPLATILGERLDPFTNNMLFPFFVLNCGRQMLMPPVVDWQNCALMIVLLMGYIGKFVGTLVASYFVGIPFSQATALALILSARGILDVASLDSLLHTNVLEPPGYTIVTLNHAITMGLLLPFVKFLYEPSRQYSTIMRHSVIDFQDHTDLLQILVCIHKEEALPGLLIFLKTCHSTERNPIAILALQLLQLTGRCAMPVMAPLHEVSSISSLRSNIDRSTRIVNSFLQIERESEGRTRAQHYVAMSSNTTMHNDICNLAYEKSVGLVVVPFHITWGADGTIKDSSLAIREVNNMVLKKAPCSVGVLVDRSNLRKGVNNDAYMISIVFVGGADDYEALAYGRIFANHPSIKLDVIWLKPPKVDKDCELDADVMKQFRKSCRNNERISIREFSVNSGEETVKIMVSMKDEIDLVVTGKYHNFQCVQLFGLSDGWSEYPELGVLGDILATSDFEFSLLVVQQEPQNEFAMECEQELHQ